MKNQNLIKTIRQGVISLIMIVALFAVSQAIVLAQNVGIGTLTPNASAALHIQSNNKGVLFPAVNIQNAGDKTTIPNPASNLVVYNTNAFFSSGRGLYHNDGSAASPNWTSVSEIKLPYHRAPSSPEVNFFIENYANNAAAGAIRGFSQVSTGLHGESASGIGVFAKGFSGNALEVEGRVKISGTGQSPAAGKVLTSDASGNATWQGAVAFSATGVAGGGNSVIPPNTDFKVPFKNVVYNLGGNYKDSNAAPHSTFVVTIPGIYHFEAHLTWSAGTPGEVRSQLSLMRTRNNSEIPLTKNDIPHLLYGSTGLVSFECSLEAGDAIHVEIRHNGSGNKDLDDTNAQYAHFSGRLVIKQ